MIEGLFIPSHALVGTPAMDAFKAMPSEVPKEAEILIATARLAAILEEPE
jgi:hypothetical protein